MGTAGGTRRPRSPPSSLGRRSSSPTATAPFFVALCVERCFRSGYLFRGLASLSRKYDSRLVCTGIFEILFVERSERKLTQWMMVRKISLLANTSYSTGHDSYARDKLQPLLPFSNQDNLLRAGAPPPQMLAASNTFPAFHRGQPATAVRRPSEAVAASTVSRRTRRIRFGSRKPGGGGGRQKANSPALPLTTCS